MPFLLIRNDITKVQADAVVNPANIRLLEGDGTSRAIYLAAGEKQLTEACQKIGGCGLGKAVITEGFALPARYIIHAVGPRWRGGDCGEEKILYSAYMEALKLAKKYGLSSVAFPLLSSGSYGYPRALALKTAVSAISDFLLENDLLVYMVLYDRGSVTVSRRLFQSIDEYIDDHYVDENEEKYRPGDFGMQYTSRSVRFPLYSQDRRSPAPAPQKKPRKLEDLMEHMGETFSQMLLRLIDEKGYTDAQVYHRANIDRRHFSKIRNNPAYVPNRKTVMAFAIALELSPDEARDLLRAAGYSFSDSSKFDVIISFFLENNKYDIFEINEVLFAYGQPLLGE